MMKRALLVSLVALACSACATNMTPGDPMAADQPAATLHSWQPDTVPRAVVIALHSHGDYHAAFNHVAPWFAERGIAVYSYDQAGFGKRANPGRWPGHEQLEQDLSASIDAIRKHYDVPLFLLGESLGGAVAINVASQRPRGDIDGLILAAPAIREGIPFRLGWNALIGTAATMAPGYTLRVERDADDPRFHGASARRLANDPHVHREVRMDAYWGLIKLADRASRRIRDVQQPTLLMYGGRDTSVPAESIRRGMRHVQENTDITYRYYPQGIHLLLQSAAWETYLTQIEHWLSEQLQPASVRATGAARVPLHQAAAM
jgi:alpha-beta hydrolase superfamily lysophospholipase